MRSNSQRFLSVFVLWLMNSFGDFMKPEWLSAQLRVGAMVVATKGIGKVRARAVPVLCESRQLGYYAE